MSLKSIYLTLLALVLSAVDSRSQTSALLNNEGGNVYITSGAYMIVHNDSLLNAAGLIQNGGYLRVDGSLYNSALLTGSPATATGVYDIGTNWINNSIVNSYQDSVILNGDVQLIGGNQITPFHSLILGGTPGSVKTQAINATVDGILDLRTSELATQDYEMLITNSSPLSLIKSTGASGFVSSLGVGRLTRSTDSQSPYLFPVGIASSEVTVLNPFYYRPVVITPVSSVADRYGARLVGNPNADNFDVASVDDTLCCVNTHYYHRLYHDGVPNAAAAISIYFDQADGSWTDIAHWKSVRWEYTAPAALGTGYGLSSLTISDWTDFDQFPFALASKKPVIDATVPRLLIPTAFSPNSDGKNDLFRPLNKDLDQIVFQVYDRWGEKIYETGTIGDGWDGTYKGMNQPIGVYVWRAMYRLNGKTQSFSESGNVTLIR